MRSIYRRGFLPMILEDISIINYGIQTLIQLPKQEKAMTWQK